MILWDAQSVFLLNGLYWSKNINSVLYDNAGISSKDFGTTRITALVTFGGGVNASGGTEKQYSTVYA